MQKCKPLFIMKGERAFGMRPDQQTAAWLYWRHGRSMAEKKVAWQNKDIIAKILSEKYKDKSFSVYGIDLPRIKEVRPTGLPDMVVDEVNMDNYFYLEDASIAITDYESKVKKGNWFKYGKYLIRTAEKYYKENKILPKLRLIVIFTADVQRATSNLNLGALEIHMTQGYLSHIDGAKEYQRIGEKLAKGEPLSDEDQMRLVILPLTVKGKRGKQQMVENVVELAKKVDDEEEQKFIIAAILANADKFIDPDYAGKVRNMLTMTKVGKIIQREIEEAVDKKEREMKEEVLKKEAEIDRKEQEKQQELLDTARSLLDLLPPEQIAEKFNLPVELILNQDTKK